MHGPFDITVIIPCHNCGRFLLEAVDSALSQRGEFSIEEVIVVDDRSDDPQTVSALESLSSENRVRVLTNDGKRGASATRNVGIRAARTRWIAFLDGDDVLPADSVASRVAAVARFPDARWIGGNWRAVDETGALLVCSDARPVQGRGVDQPPLGEEIEFVREALDSGTPIRLRRPVSTFLRRSISLTSTHLVEKSLLEEVGLYDEDMLTYEDRDLYIRLARVADFVWVPQIMFHYRQHGTNTTGSEGRMLQGILALMRKLHADPDFESYRDLIRSRLHHVALMNAYHFRGERQRRQGVAASLWAIRAAPASGKAWKSLAAALLGR